MGKAGLGQEGRRGGRVPGVRSTLFGHPHPHPHLHAYIDGSVRRRRAMAAIAVVTAAVAVAAVVGGWFAPRELASATPLILHRSARPLHATKGRASLPDTSGSGTSGTTTSGQTAAIPAYWYPDSTTSTSTNQLLDTPSGDVSFIIADASPGDGASLDPNYVSAIDTYEREGIKVYGYVDTDYGNRSLSSVEAEVSDWYAWYRLNGIFFDDASSSPALAGPGTYYNELYQFVKSMTGPGVLGTTVALNPGTVPAEGYMADSDVICDFEGTEATYVSTTFPAWVNSYPATRFWNIVYDSAGITQMQKDVSLARARNAGYVFVTTLGGANPYGQMPSSTFWSAEVSALTNARLVHIESPFAAIAIAARGASVGEAVHVSSSEGDVLEPPSHMRSVDREGAFSYRFGQRQLQAGLPSRVRDGGDGGVAIGGKADVVARVESGDSHRGTRRDPEVLEPCHVGHPSCLHLEIDPQRWSDPQF